MRILVTGAAGYIGSVVTEQLVEQGHQVFALDNLVNGHRAAVHPSATFAQVDLLDADGLVTLLRKHPVDAVVHLAAEALIDVSMRDPGLFFRVNVVGGLNLLDAMIAAGVQRMVFSSTAAVYGEPENIPITEEARHLPVNPYGESKLAFEKILAWYRTAHDLKYVTLRYFNACGATERFGEYHIPETHIIPILFEVALGQREQFNLYGTDYDTPDGTCVRDYIHVWDIANAHVLALGQLDRLGARVFNMGNGAGYSNSLVVETVRRVTGKNIPVVPSSRRPGDPARLVASSEHIRSELGWVPRYPDLTTMVETAWRWRQKHPRGYETK
jgi:UDP-glucose 4-epimerase